MAGEFDLFAFLAKLNRRDLLAYDSLSPEQQKNAHPFIALRWLAGTSDEAQIIRLNEFANRYVFSLGTEKPLLFKLLGAACTGKTHRTTWLKGPGSKSDKLAIQAIMTQYECSTREARDYLPLLDASDVVRFAEDAGWDKDQLKKLTTELGKDDAGQGSSPKSRRKPKK